MELLVLAVDSGKNLDIENLAMYTSSPELVYGYERNAEFARDVLKEASAPESCDKVCLLCFCCHIYLLHMYAITRL